MPFKGSSIPHCSHPWLLSLMPRIWPGCFISHTLNMHSQKYFVVKQMRHYLLTAALFFHTKVYWNVFLSYLPKIIVFVCMLLYVMTVITVVLQNQNLLCMSACLFKRTISFSLCISVSGLEMKKLWGCDEGIMKKRNKLQLRA